MTVFAETSSASSRPGSVSPVTFMMMPTALGSAAPADPQTKKPARSASARRYRGPGAEPPSPPLGAERVGVRWGIPRAVPTSPSHRSAMGPSLSPLKGGEGQISMVFIGANSDLRSRDGHFTAHRARVVWRRSLKRGNREVLDRDGLGRGRMLMAFGKLFDPFGQPIFEARHGDHPFVEDI